MDALKTIPVASPQMEDEEKQADSNLTQVAMTLYGSSDAAEEGEEADSDDEELAAAAGASRSSRGNGKRDAR